MQFFYGVPVFSNGDATDYLLTLETPDVAISKIRNGVESNKLVLIRGAPFDTAAGIFGELVDHYCLRASYEVQMQYVVHLMEDRTGVKNVAVTVNERGPFQIIQSHSEGDSTAQLDLFGLHCVQNAVAGGENILSLINQSADHSILRAKEKAIVDRGLSKSELEKLRRRHRDAKDVLPHYPPGCRILAQSERGGVVVRPVALKASKSSITKESLLTYWDNVTVHDRAFHRHQYELLRKLEVLHERVGTGYEAYMHVEKNSPWAPADTESGDVSETAKLFRCHVLHKMRANELLVFNNRAWTHSVNNWPPNEVRRLTAMYA